MREQIERWLTNTDVPVDYRNRLADLLRLHDRASNEERGMAEAEIVSVMRDLRDYVHALMVWEGEGGR
jgi:hypothetical protein